MATENETIEVLNDLIQINNDRIEGYARAVSELKEGDMDLKILFENMIDDSRKARLALGTEVQALGGTMETGTTKSGKIYRVWMDVKAVFTGHDRHHVLENCHTGEHAAQRAYASALEVEHLPAYIIQIITAQQQQLKVRMMKLRHLVSRNSKPVYGRKSA